MNYIIELTDVNFAYGQQPILQAVNFHVHVGEFQAIVGPNGGGKTTLLKLMLGLLSPQKGNINILGTSPVKARRMIGYMAQQSRLDSAFPIQALDLVKMGCLGAALTKSRQNAVAAEALERVGLAGLERRKVANLSGGQQKRVLIARALVSEPRILILDEPTAHLDPKAEQEFFDLLAALNEKGITILIVSHDLSFVSSYIQRVVCVNRQVVVHPLGEMAPEIISRLYGQPMRSISHHLTDNCC